MRHIRPRKGLGQSFLTYEPVADALVDALRPAAQDTVLEIGPGKGVLTSRLLALAGSVLAVELDERLVAGLRLELGANPALEVVHDDFMEFDLSRLSGLLVMGNLPYNLSSQMLFRLLDNLQAWDRAVLTTQREFALRLLAAPGGKEYGALTVFFDRLTVRERLFNIQPECFKPHPDVVSTAFRLTRRLVPAYDVGDEARFRRIVKACFVQRRKTVANNLAAGLGMDKPHVHAFLDIAGIEPIVRSETLSGEEFKRLAAAVGAMQD